MKEAKMLSLVETLRELVFKLETELEKFENGNLSAGTRARAILQDIKGTAQVVRVEIQVKKGRRKLEAGPRADVQD
jgi:hypothetical protein